MLLLSLVMMVAPVAAEEAAARLGVAVSADREGPLAGAHVDISEPVELFEGPDCRTVVRVDVRGWRHPTLAEQEGWADRGVEDLPAHSEFELTGSMLLRLRGFERSWGGMKLGAETGITAGLWHHATIAVQQEYAALGAAKWPLEEYLLGPELGLGLYAPEDGRKLMWVHRFWIPLHGRLDGQENRYEVGDRVFMPVEVVNPRFEGGITGLYTWEHLFVQGTASYVLVLPSVKNREVDQAPPQGSVRLDAVFGWSF